MLKMPDVSFQSSSYLGWFSNSTVAFEQEMAGMQDPQLYCHLSR